MKYSAVALAAFVAVASAQDISIIPSCALDCIDKAALKVCDAKDDYKCICEKKDSLVGSATTCVIGACGADVALQEVLPATETFCEEVLNGGGSEAPASSAAATTAAPASSSAAAAPSSSAAATTEAPAESSSAPATTLAPSSGTAPAPSSNGTVSVAPPTSSSPVEAGAAIAGYIGSFGVAALAALAAF